MKKPIYALLVFITITILASCSSQAVSNAILENIPVSSNTTSQIASQTPNGVETDIPSNWKVYRYSDYGYEVAYPQNYNAVLSGGHSPVANPELGMRLSLSSKGSQPGVDIDSIDKADYKDKYQNVEEYINYKHLNIMFDEDIIINDKTNKIYKLEEGDYYFSFFDNENYIFQISSGSKEILKKIMATFNFIPEN